MCATDANHCANGITDSTHSEWHVPSLTLRIFQREKHLPALFSMSTLSMSMALSMILKTMWKLCTSRPVVAIVVAAAAVVVVVVDIGFVLFAGDPWLTIPRWI